MTSTAAGARPVRTGRVAAWWHAGRGLWAARFLAGLSTAASVVAAAIVTREASWRLAEIRDLPVDIAVGISFPLAALLVLSGSGGRVIAGLLLGAGVAGAGTAVGGAVLVTAPATSGTAVAAAFLYGVLWVPAFVPLLTLLPLLYPDGQVPGPRWRAVVPAAAVGMVLLAAASALHPDTYAGHGSAPGTWTSAGLSQSLFVVAAK